MELRDIRYFVAVAEHENIGRAADALELTATALSKSLRRLEKSVGAKLVQRAAKGVSLTAVGAALLNRIRPLEGTLADVRHEAADLAQGRAGHVTAGVNAGAQHELRLASACGALAHESPKITFKVTVGNNDVLSQALHKGEIDFAIAAPRLLLPTEFMHEHLYDESFIIFASAHHRLAKRKQISLAELATEPWATALGTSLPYWQILFRTFEQKGLAIPAMALECNSLQLRNAAIACSNFVSITSAELLLLEERRFPLVELPVKEFSYSRKISIVYRKNAYLSPAARRLIDILKKQAREMTEQKRALRSRY